MGRRSIVMAVSLAVLPFAPQMEAQEEPRAKEQPQEPEAGVQLPAGAKVRVWTRGVPRYAADEFLGAADFARRLPGSARLEGYLVKADATTVTIVPKSREVLLSGEIVVPRSSIERMELGLDKKRHWLDGLLVGLGVGLVMGLTEKVDPVVCKVDEYVPCTRTGALVEDPLIGGAVGAGVGALVNTQAWTPVAPEALVVQPAREARNRRPGVQFTIRF